MIDDVAELASALVSIDSRSFVSNLPVAERIEAALSRFDVDRLDYVDPAGVAKRVIVAHKGRGTGGLALSGHMDTVPDTGWQDDPWSGRIAGGMLHGLGSTDMKGPVASCILAACALPDSVPVTLLLTTDEETTKGGARVIVERSDLVRRAKPAMILVAEPTRMIPVRGHRAHVAFVAVATGVQAHSSTGKGYNANWRLVEFLAEMKAIYTKLREDPALQDTAYDPVFSDFNIVINNHGAAVNVTVPTATVQIKFRYSARVDPAPVVNAVREAAARAGLALSEAREGTPPELPADHPFVRLVAGHLGVPATTAPYGTDASVLQQIAPCIVLGPGDIGHAHKPAEAVALAELAAAIPVFMTLAERVAATSD
jgi:acetylornithine deacetylase